MAKKVLALIFGILFALSLAFAGYWTFIFSFVATIAGVNVVFIFLPFVLWAVAIVSMIGSCFAIAFPKVTAFMLLPGIAVDVMAAISMFTIIPTIGITWVYFVSLAFGIVSIILAFLSKRTPPTPYVSGPVLNAGQAGTTTAQSINISVNLKGNKATATPKTKKCGYCGSTVDASDRKCPSCGAGV